MDQPARSSKPSPAPEPTSRRDPKSPRARLTWKGWLARLILLGVVCVLSLLVLEFLIRVFLPYYNPRNQFALRRNDQGVALGFPNTRSVQGTPKGDFVMEVAFNRHGFRDTKDFVNARPDDIFVVGDSFSIGWGVAEDERYSNLLEKTLGRPVFNVAIPENIGGYRRTVEFVQQNGARPRHMILGLCMENDLWNYDSAVDLEAIYRQRMYRTWLHRTAAWFKANSAIWIALSHTLQRHESVRRVFEKIGVARNIDELTHKNEASPEVLESSRRHLLGIVTNYNSVVLVIPSRALWHGNQIEQEKLVHEKFVASLASSGVKLVDMKSHFEKDGNPLQFYFKSDPHWNPRGHALAAQALHDFLIQDSGWAFLNASPPPDSKPTNPP